MTPSRVRALNALTRPDRHVSAVVHADACWTLNQIGVNAAVKPRLRTVPAIVVNTGANAVITWLAGRAWAHIALETDLEQSVENLVRAMLASLTGWLAERG